MYLREVDFSADDEIVNRHKGGFAQQFFFDSYCICLPYSSLIRLKIPTVDDWKISITFYDTVVDEPPMSRCLPIRTRWPFDFSRYVSATNLEKKRMMLEGLHAASLWVAEQMCWNTAPLQAAYETLLKADCEWSYVSKKQWLSPDRTLKVRVAVDLDIPMHHLMLNVYQPRTESIIKRIPLRLLHPINSPSYFNVKNGRWVSNDQFAFQDGYHPETFVDFPPLS